MSIKHIGHKDVCQAINDLPYLIDDFRRAVQCVMGDLRLGRGEFIYRDINVTVNDLRGLYFEVTGGAFDDSLISNLEKVGKAVDKDIEHSIDKVWRSAGAASVLGEGCYLTSQLMKALEAKDENWDLSHVAMVAILLAFSVYAVVGKFFSTIEEKALLREKMDNIMTQIPRVRDERTMKLLLELIALSKMDVLMDGDIPEVSDLMSLATEINTHLGFMGAVVKLP